MAEADLSKIVGMIMDNPDLIEQIKRMSQNEESTEEKAVSDTDPNPKDTRESSEGVDTYEQPQQNNSRTRRKDLLYALKSYVSEERGKAIDTMMSIADILDMMRQK